MTEPTVPEEFEEMDEVDEVAKAYILSQRACEADRLRSAGVKPLELPVKNYGIVRHDDHQPPMIINRIEIDTGFDLNRIRQILVSEPVKYSHRSGFHYVNLLLITENPMIPILLPYLYTEAVKATDAKQIKNDLREWVFINSKGLRARHSVQEYHCI
ncbi:uncharacterized protein EV422DRAFT_424317 [Fimicolochytrium jonesii]|uniref:uncharacterized protein n=1 Tax=Fimicolochytrium jonesii TaxID=1396493 RepID=UPI0022FEFECB|nr:uncharacterized protein EV422DRAFT_424317 [Fimicolochytrium jonesii]KAI8821626.1 hypothetical protein EV422DRAFT_424317 [Fimicolochytrium jonesii]